MKIQTGKRYVSSKRENTIQVLSLHGTTDKMYVTYQYLDDPQLYETPMKDFYKAFVSEESPKKQNVNQDILKLIEAGYEFSSFWGDTVDGRSINVDLNEEEVK